MEFIRPFKMNNKKYESVDDAFSVVNMISMLIRGLNHNKWNIRIGGNGIADPEKIISDPKAIASQFIFQQRNAGYEDPHCRRVYNCFYVLPKCQYGYLSLDTVFSAAQAMALSYPEYASVYVACMNKTEFSIYLIINNLSMDGMSRMTREFNAYRLNNVMMKTYKTAMQL